MCMKVRVTEGTLQESCHDLQTEAEYVDQKERLSVDQKERLSVDQKLSEDHKENLVDKEEDPDLLDTEMEMALRQVVRSNRVDIEVLFVVPSLHRSWLIHFKSNKRILTPCLRNSVGFFLLSYFRSARLSKQDPIQICSHTTFDSFILLIQRRS